MRLDLNQASVETIYVTIWASPNVSLHLGKIENADEIWRKHVGVRLQVSFCPKKDTISLSVCRNGSFFIWFFDFHGALTSLCFLLKIWFYHPSNSSLLYFVQTRCDLFISEIKKVSISLLVSTNRIITVHMIPMILDMPSDASNSNLFGKTLSVIF